MSDKKQRVLNMIIHGDTIRLNKSTRVCPITVRDIAWGAMITETNDTYPKTRDFIRELIEDGYCIGSNSKGYFLITSGHECQRYLNSLMKRQIGISKRIEAVYNSAVEGGLL